MPINLLTTSDGSHSLYSSDFDEPYHSQHGAIQESNHVFINAGMRYSTANPMTIFEVGFGTGLNVLLSFVEAEIRQIPVMYYAIELYPISMAMVEQLNFCEIIGLKYQEYFNLLHSCEWDKPVKISNLFHLHKINADFTIWQHKAENMVDLVYFDAFAPDKQAEMWQNANFQKIYDILNDRAVLTTYSVKGEIKRMLRSIGFKVATLPGPPGKRHCLRAEKC